MEVKRFKMVGVLLLIFFGIPIQSICQAHPFTLKVRTNGLSVKKLGIGEPYWWSLQALHAAIKKYDSCYSDDNLFLFKGTTLYPTAIRIFPLDKTKFFSKLIFIDTGYQEVNLTNKDSSVAIKTMTPVEMEHRKFLNEMGVKTLDDSIDGKRLLAYVKRNPNSYVALFAIINQVYNYPYQPVFDSVNEAFGDKITQTKAFQFYLNTFSPKTKANVDPKLLGTDINGKTISLTSFRNNKYILLDFWATWCKPCLDMNPHLQKLNQEYYSKGLQVISISSSLADKKEVWKKMVKREKMQAWINVFAEKSDSTGPDPAIKYGVTSIPTVILIDKKGDVIGRWVGFSQEILSQLDEKLSKELE